MNKRAATVPIGLAVAAWATGLMLLVAVAVLFGRFRSTGGFSDYGPGDCE